MDSADWNTDRAVIERAAAGDDRACAALYRRYQPVVAGLVWRVSQDPDEQDDLVQDTFIKAFRGLPGFKHESRFSTWLTKVGLNVCNTHLRVRKRRQALHETLVEHVLREAALSAAPSPDVAVQRDERRRALAQALDTLPPDVRDVMHKRYTQHLTYREIVDQVGRPSGTVKVWMHRGRKLLKERLATLEARGDLDG